ncbi:MAG: hypothetical protein L3J91_03030 [Thermoplasmata archaeon]|nr:hypothetical protein [Thermoplasmata archaeon]
MAWVRIDDSLSSHPKILQAWSTDHAAIGLWPLAASWAGRHLTDGHVSPDFVGGLMPARRPREQAIGALVEAGLWVPNGTGWQIHDWQDYNGTRASIEARRRIDAARKRR